MWRSGAGSGRAGAGAAVAPAGDRCAAEVQRAPGGVEHHLDDVRVQELGRVVDGVRRGGSPRSPALRPAGRRRRRTRVGSISGSSPCTLTTMSSPSRPSCAQASARRSLPLAWSRARQQGLHAVGGAGVDDAPVVGGDHHAQRAGRAPRARPRARPSAGRRCRPAACPAAGSTPAGPGSGR